MQKRLLNPAEVAGLLGCSRSHVYTLEDRGVLPRRVRLSARTSGWLPEQVEAMLAQRAGLDPVRYEPQRETRAGGAR